MARSKQVTKKATKPAEAPLTTKAASGTPYQLDPAQVERAANALVAHMKKHASAKQEVAATKDLLADDDDDVQENDQPIFLSVSTKKHVNNTNRLKPTKMSVYDEKKVCASTRC
jgi:ribosome biogenesis protein UTP30